VFYQLCGNVLVNGFNNVYPHHVGLGSSNRDVDVPIVDYLSDNNVGGLSVSPEVRALRMQHPCDMENRPTERAEIRTLDSYGYTGVRLLKIDVEGMELEVIKGAAATLEKSGYPPIIFEVWKKHKLPALAGHVDALLNHVSALGYVTQVVGD